MPCQPARDIRAESSITFGKRAALQAAGGMTATRYLTVSDPYIPPS